MTKFTWNLQRGVAGEQLFSRTPNEAQLLDRRALVTSTAFRTSSYFESEQGSTSQSICVGLKVTQTIRAFMTDNRWLFVGLPRLHRHSTREHSFFGSGVSTHRRAIAITLFELGGPSTEDYIIEMSNHSSLSSFGCSRISFLSVLGSLDDPRPLCSRDMMHQTTKFTSPLMRLVADEEPR